MVVAAVAGPDDDFDLLRAWRSGDSRAGNALVQRHFHRVYRFFRSKVDGDVEDLVQRTFLGCTEAIEGFRGESAFRTFLLGIARFQLLRFYRDRVRRGSRAVCDVSVAELVGASTPSHALSNAQEHRILLGALRRLSLDLQTTVELFYWERLPIADIAQILEVPAGTIKSRLARARDLLRKHVAELAQAEQ